ncbi:hypothetical protein COM24_05760 [Bacillus toyonensis]|uniref:hypothetical protein n=1 Tax=Bacillus toyonensis TaxID=155322 RepID=UPI000BF45251|nr:hypothetical protein [Bacillus toyonensis]PGC57658.1 hypothetical protein COM24_05760 [Bacillus toyonensis]
MPDEHGHGEGTHWAHVDIPEYFKYIQHGDHVDLGEHVMSHSAFYNPSEGLQHPVGAPPGGHTPTGYHWIGIPKHYDGHGDHMHEISANWGLHPDH